MIKEIKKSEELENQTTEKILLKPAKVLDPDDVKKLMEELGFLIVKKNKQDPNGFYYNYKWDSCYSERRLYNIGISRKIIEKWVNGKNSGCYTLSFRPDMNQGKFLDETEEPCWNTFNGWQITPEKRDWALIKDFLFRIICHSNESDFEYLLKWCSKIISHPESKSGVAIALGGAQGSGKTTFYNIIKTIIGGKYCARTNKKALEERFNGFLMNNILCYMNESCLNDELYEMTKEWITDDETRIQFKGVDCSTEKNFSNFILATNKPNMVDLTADDRRWFILETSNEEIGTEYFANFYQGDEFTDKVKNELAGFMEYLYELDIKRLEKPPLNEAKKEQIKMAETKIISWFNDWIKEPECKEHSFISGTDKVIKASVAHNAFEKDPNGENVNIKYFIKELERNGRMKTKLIRGAKYFIITDLLNNEETTIEEMLNVEENKI